MRRRSCLLGLVAAPFATSLRAAAPDTGAPASSPAAASSRAAEAVASPVPVVASITILADMVRAVGGDLVRVDALVGPDADPHVFEPRPADLRTIGAARVVVENGLGLEGWLSRLFAAGKFSGVRVTAARGVKPLMTTEAGRLAADPHAWQDPRNGVIYAAEIAAGLARADPAHADAYRRQAAGYGDAIRETDAWIERQFAPIPPAARRIITTHDAFGYYGARYGIELLAAEGLSTEAEPSARGLASLVAQIKREKIRAVFLENMTDPRIAGMLVRETGAVLGGTVYSDALSAANGPAPTYLAMLRHNTALFARAMMPA